MNFASDVREGFVRTDVLLYGSICEAALYVVAKDSFRFEHDKKACGSSCCFPDFRKKILPLGNQTFTLEGDTPHPGCKIGFCYTKEPRKSRTAKYPLIV